MRTKTTETRLTDAVAGRTARVQHPEHAERRGPQRGVSVAHPRSLAHSGLPYSGVSHPGSTSGAPAGVTGRIHRPRGVKALETTSVEDLDKVVVAPVPD